MIDEERRGQLRRRALCATAWAQILDDCIGFLTATAKQWLGSDPPAASVPATCRRAGRPFPDTCDFTWGCNAELLRFDTNSLRPHFEREVPVIELCRVLRRAGSSRNKRVLENSINQHVL